MLRVTLRSFWEHKRRMVSTIVAIVLGVMFMAGTLVLTDTINRVFDDLFAEGNEKIDAQVQGDVIFSDPFGGGDQRSMFDPDVLDAVRAVDGVARAEPFVLTFGFGSTNRVLGADGDPIGASQGPPTLLESWTDLELSPYRLTDGRGPEADDEMAINQAAAESGELAVGDEVVVVSQFGRQSYTLVGIFTFGTAKSAAGAVSADFTLAEAQRLAGTDGRIQQVIAAAEPGVSPGELVARIAPVLPDGTEVITGEEAADQLASDVQSGFSFFQQMLLIFVGIALLVGVFVISNTFSILVAQRTRELALLRAVGAGRRQVLVSVLLEAVLVGVLAALLGLAAGIGLAQGLVSLLDAIGSDLPTTTLVIAPATVIASLVVGLGVTLVAAFVPAIRATRVPPLAALRDVAIDRSGASRIRIVGGVLVLLVGLYNLSEAWRADGDTDAIPTVGMGALLVLIGAIVIGPVLAGPSIRALGAGVPLLKGITGKLAAENAARSPKRTSATASAVVIGVALVSFITIFAASATRSVSSEVERGFTGDFVVQSDVGAFGPPSGFPSSVAEATRAVDGVSVVSAVGFSMGEMTYPSGSTAVQFITAIEPDSITDVLAPRMDVGDVRDLTDDGILVDRQLARRNNVSIGDRISLTVPGGDSFEAEVEGISDDTTLLGFFTITRTRYADLAPELLDIQLVGKVGEGADLETVLADIREATADTPSLAVLDREDFIGDLASQITSFVTVIYVLLILTIIIAIIGIANTLSLSINERTRELGLLRAVGMAKAQMRSAVRWEAALITVLGTLVGLGLGLGLSLALVKSLEGFGLTLFSIPIVTLAVITVVAALLGTVASWRPARRAARLPVLEAIATE